MGLVVEMNTETRIHAWLGRALAESETAATFLAHITTALAEDATAAGVAAPIVEFMQGENGSRVVIATAGHGRAVGTHVGSADDPSKGSAIRLASGEQDNDLWLVAQPEEVVPSGSDLQALRAGVIAGLRRFSNSASPLQAPGTPAALAFHAPLPDAPTDQVPWYLSHSPFAVLAWDGDGKLVQWEGAAERLFGWRKADVLGKNWSQWRFVHEDDRDQVEAAAARLYGQRVPNGGAVTDDEVVYNRNYTRDGRVLECRWHNHVVVAADGRQLGMRSLVEDVTEAAALKRAVESSRDQLASYLSNAPIGIIEWDRDLRVRRFAGAAESIFGISAAEALGKTQLELALFRWAAGQDPFPALLANAGSGTYSASVRRPDGTLRSTRLHAFVFRNFAGRDGGLVCFVEDVSERIAAQSALAETESTYRTLVEASPYCIHQMDMQGTLLSINPAGLEMMGVRHESDLVGKRFLGCVAARDRENAQQAFTKTAAGEPTLFTFQAVNGRTIETSLVPVEDAAMRLTIMGLSQDITERRTAELSLRATEERLELAISGAELGLWDWSVASGRLVLSDAWIEHLGYRPEEHGGSPTDWEALMHSDDRPRVIERFYQHLEDITPSIETEYRVRTKSGEWRWVLTRGRVVERGPDGTAIRAAGTHLDVTVRHRLTEQLTQSQKMESVGQLAGGIAHDFNNLLLVMLSNTYLASRVAAEASIDLSDILSEIRRAAERASELTQKLLLFSRREVLSLVAVDMGKLVAGIVPMIRRLIPESIEIHVVPHGQLPAVLGDAGKLEQVLVNLSVNARDAMPDGGRLTIEVESVWINGEYRKHHPWAVPGRYVLVSVSDTGVGITPEVAARMFEPFYTTKPQGLGTGLGLAVVHGIIEQHHGMINAYGEPGSGSVFKFYIPIAERPASTVGAKVEGSVPRGHGEQILVAEDDALVQRLVVRILEAAGYNVTLAEHGGAAVEMFAASPDSFDLVLLDVVMPRLSGRQAYEQIRALRPAIRVLFTSGYSADSLPADFLRESGAELLAKPYDPDRLLRRVAAMLTDTNAGRQAP